MMYDNIPEDLVWEILSRVPATSLIRLRSTCKRWNAIIQDPEFIEKQFSHSTATKQSTIIILAEEEIYSMNMNPSINLETIKDSFYDSDKFYIDDIFYCHGLLLCTTRRARKGKLVVQLVVWNPCLGQTKWIHHRDSFDIVDIFALGYDHSNNRYKILRISFSTKSTHSQKKFEIYDYNSDIWEVLDDENVISDYWSSLGHGVSLNGNAYWFGYDASQKVESSTKEEYMLISFNFSTNKFQPKTPLPFPLYTSDFIISLSDVREEQLLLSTQTRSVSSKIEIYLTTNNKNDKTSIVLSWSKFLTIEPCGVHFWYETRFFILDEGKKIVVSCDTSRFSVEYGVDIIGDEANGVREFVLGEFDWLTRPLMFNYIPSLVQIQMQN